MIGPLSLDKLIHKYELEIQSIELNMEDHERWGSGAYYQHRLTLYRRFVAELKIIRNQGEVEDGVQS